MTERCSQKGAARLFDSEVGSQLEQRDGDTLVKVEIEKTGAAQQQPAPLLQIVLMKSPECRLRTIRTNALETIPAKTTNPAIIVGFASKIEPAKSQRGKFRDRTRRN